VGLTLAISMAACGTDATPADDSSKDAPEIHPFYVTRFFERIPSVPPSDPKSTAGQIYAQLLPSVGREDLHVAAVLPQLGPEPCALPIEHTQEAIDEISQRAEETRILIINEAHDRPLHRHFVQQVALRVQQIGYVVFAAETFSERIEDGQQPRYARWFDGYYSNEPVFGELIGTLKKNGFKLAQYEHRPADTADEISQYDRADQREEGQANNLMRILAEMADDERLLIHVGYSHASEVPIMSFGGNKLAWMASRLKEKSGVDPLTIDQTDCLSPSGRTVLTAASRRHAPSQFDLVVGHPEIRLHEGRPLWRQENGATKVEIPDGLLSADHRVLVEAREEGQTLDAVPVDRVLIWPGENMHLLLPPGTYELISFFEGGNARNTETVVVKK